MAAGMRGDRLHFFEPTCPVDDEHDAARDRESEAAREAEDAVRMPRWFWAVVVLAVLAVLIWSWAHPWGVLD
jgi:hypothetical protein